MTRRAASLSVALPPGSNVGYDVMVFVGLERFLRCRQREEIQAIPLLLVTLYFYLAHRASLRREVEAHIRSIAENRRNTVDLYLQERVVNVSTAFRPGAFEIPPSGSELRRVLEELQEENGAFTDVGLFDPEGTLVAYAGPHRSLLVSSQPVGAG